MPVFSRKIKFIKLAVVLIAAIFAVFGLHNFSAKYEKVNASASGPTPSHTGAPNESNCTACHSDFPVNSGTGSVSISNISANYLPGQIIPMTVTTSQADAIIYGFQLTAVDSLGRRAGTFTLPTQTPAQTQVVGGIVNGIQRSYVEHTVNGIIPTVFGTKSWTFNWNAPAQRVGKISFYVSGNAANSDGSTSGDYIYTSVKSTLSGTAISNFDADGKSDVAVFRPSNGYWYNLNSTDGSFQAVPFGTSGDKAVAGDYDGDGRTDYAVWRPSTGYWYVLKSSGGLLSVQFGASGDVPVVGDYDGDLKSDLAVYRPSNNYWYYLKSSDGTFVFTQFGTPNDKTAQGDYDGDGKTDIAVFRPSTSSWYINRSRDGFTGIQFGESNDTPVPADYDGDGKTDVAVFRPSNGGWYLQKSRDGFIGVTFGISIDKPVPADYDGDGKSDIAVFRNGFWYILRSSDGSFSAINFGISGDIPVPSGYIMQ